MDWMNEITLIDIEDKSESEDRSILWANYIFKSKSNHEAEKVKTSSIPAAISTNPTQTAAITCLNL